MFERLLETWLDSASERAFQAPFCHSLIAEGHKLVHSTRHSAMEMGKDVISVAPDGVPCAYQLKALGGQRMTLARFRADLEPQLTALALNQIEHPSIPPSTDHRSYVVVTGDLDEEVQRSLADLNRTLLRRNLVPKGIQTIVKGELLARFRSLSSDFWPQEPADIRTWLEVYMSNGRGPLPRGKLAVLAEKGLGLDGKKPIRKSAISAAIAGVSILLEFAISPFSEASNRLAEVHTRVISIACALAAAERSGAAERVWKPHIELLEESCFQGLQALVEEFHKRPFPVEGDPLTDFAVYPVRVTELMGWTALFGLWSWIRSKDPAPPDMVRDLIVAKNHRIELWGEHALPQILITYLFRREVQPGFRTEALLPQLVDHICTMNGPNSPSPGLPSPYYEPEQALPFLLSLEPWPVNDTFRGWSYGLETVVYLMAMENLKATLKNQWSELTKIMNLRFQPRTRWNGYLWRSPGRLVMSNFPRPTEWTKLKQGATGRLRTRAPRLLAADPIRYLSFLMTYPQRIDAGSFLHAARQLRRLIRAAA